MSEVITPEEYERLLLDAERGRVVSKDEWTDGEWIAVLSRFSPRMDYHAAQRWVWEKRMAERE